MVIGKLQTGLDMHWQGVHVKGVFACAAGFESTTAECVTDGFLRDCGHSFIQVIGQILLVTSGLITHCPHDHWCSKRRDIAWNSRPREIDGRLELLPFFNNCSNSCCLLTKLLAYCPVSHPSLVQVCNFILMSLHSFLVLAIVERLVFYRCNRFKQLELMQEMCWKQEGFSKKNLQVGWSLNSYWLIGDQILMSCNKMQIDYLKILKCDFLDFGFRLFPSELKSTFDTNYRSLHAS